MRPWLVAEHLTEGHTQWHQVADIATVVGRSSEDDPTWFVVDFDPTISRRHFSMKWENGKLQVTRDGGRHPLYFDGLEKEAFELAPGDFFTTGQTRFTLTQTRSHSAPASAEPADELAAAVEEVLKGLMGPLNPSDIMEKMEGILEKRVPFQKALAVVRQQQALFPMAGRGFPGPQEMRKLRGPVVQQLFSELEKTRRPIELESGRAWHDAVPEGVRWAVVPMAAADLSGLLFLGRDGDASFSESELALLERLSLPAGFALQSARLVQDLQRVASTDDATGVYTRRALLALAERALSHSRGQKQALTFLFFDIEGFRQANDEHGFSAGDRLLRHVADKARGVLREGDVLGRLEGDTFMVVMMAPEDGAKHAIERLTNTLRAAPLTLETTTLQPSVRTSILTNMAEDAKLDALLRQGVAGLTGA
ncbi:MAG: diguanylate cyclase domain-containing protein [Candidatus Xenobia bacterium]